MSSYVDLPISFKRLSPDPLENNSSFDTLNELLNYASSSFDVYPGQVCFCVETESLYVIDPNNSVYLIKKPTSAESTLFRNFWTNLSLTPSYSATSNSTVTIGITGNNLLVYPLSGLSSFSAASQNCGGDIDASNCINLTMLDCSYNQISSLNVSECTKLVTLNLINNPLKSLSVSGCPVIANLSLSGLNQITDIKLSDINFKELNASQLTTLSAISGSRVALSAIRINGCTNLTKIDINEGRVLSHAAVDNIIESLVNNGTYNGQLNLFPGVSGPTCKGEYFGSILQERGWTVNYGPVFSDLLFVGDEWLDDVIWLDCSIFSTT